MEVTYKKKFLKQLAKLPPQVRSDVENFVFSELPEGDNLTSTGKVEKMQGYTGFYKVRFGSYRIGLRAESNSSAEIVIVVHRREIHQRFP